MLRGGARIPCLLNIKREERRRAANTAVLFSALAIRARNLHGEIHPRAVARASESMENRLGKQDSLSRRVREYASPGTRFPLAGFALAQLANRRLEKRKFAEIANPFADSDRSSGVFVALDHWTRNAKERNSSGIYPSLFLSSSGGHLCASLRISAASLNRTSDERAKTRT